MHSTPWLTGAPVPRARVRLYCFSYAGGSAAYYAPWRGALGPGIEVCAIQLPGRGMRLDTPALRTFEPVVSGIAQAMAVQDAMPFAFFGHSLGAVVAFEVARYRRKHGLTMPCHMFSSGCAAPAQRSVSRGLHELDDIGLIEALRKYNGTPAAVLEQPELLDLILPIIRADFALSESYVYSVDAPLDLPFSVFAGRQDERTSPEQIEGWRVETSVGCSVRWFEGDHFFINPHRTTVLECVRGTLLAHAR